MKSIGYSGSTAKRAFLAIAAFIILSVGAGAAETVPLRGSLRYSDARNPAVGLTVSLFLRRLDPGDEHRSWSASTDARGHFFFPGIPARRVYALTLRGPAYPLYQSNELVTAGHTPRRLPPLTIPPARCSTGTIVDDHGKPVAGATVAFLAKRPLRPPDALLREYAFESGYFLHIFETASDVHGRFALWGLVTEPEGIVKVTAPSYGTALRLLRRSRSTPLRVRLGRGRQVRGRVVNTWGDPIVGVEVVARPRLPSSWHWMELLAIRARSATDGSFLLDGIRRGVPYDIVGAPEEEPLRGFLLRGDGGLESRRTIVLVARREPEWSSTPWVVGSGAATLKASILDAKSGAPVEGAQIEMWPAGSHVKHSEQGSASDAEGRIEVPGLLPDEEYWTTVRAPGFAPCWLDIVFPNDGNAKKIIRLSPAALLKVRCLDGAGAPLPNVPISTLIHGSNYAGHYTRGYTDQHGMCVFRDGGPAGMETVQTLGLRIFDNGPGWLFTISHLPVVDGIATVRGPFHEVRGLVRDTGGKPVVGAAVRFTYEIKPHTLATAYTDEEGAFVMHAVSKGWYMARVKARGMRADKMKCTVRDATPAPLPLLLAEAPVPRVQIIDDRGKPIPGIYGGGPRGHRACVTDEKGWLPVGKYTKPAIDHPFYKSVHEFDQYAIRASPDREKRPHVLERRGRILIPLDAETTRGIQENRSALKTHLETWDGRIVHQPPFRLLSTPRRHGIAIECIRPDRYSVCLERLGPYLRCRIDDVEVLPLQTTTVASPKLVVGARLVVDVKQTVGMIDEVLHDWSLFAKYSFVTSGSREDTVTLGPSIDGSRFVYDGLPAAGGVLEINLHGTYPTAINITDLELGKTRTVVPNLEPWPRIAGRVTLRGGSFERLGLCIEKIYTNGDVLGEGDDDYDDSEIDNPLWADEKGHFALALKGGRYKIFPIEFKVEEREVSRIAFSGYARIKCSEDSTGPWRLVRPETFTVQRNQKQIDLEVVVEWRGEAEKDK